MGLGYLDATFIFAMVFLAFVAAQVRSRAFHPWLYWCTIIATTTVGTTLADFADRSLGMGYPGGASLLLALVWAAFILTRPLGAALGDFLDKPVASGGLAFSRYEASAILLTCIVLGVLALPQRAARRVH